MKTQNTNKIRCLSALIALPALVLALSGCGGGGGNSSSSGSNNTGQGGDLAPASLAGKTFHGHISGTSVNWQIVFGGSGTSGNYTHTEPPYGPENGTYTYSKTGSDSGVVSLSYNGTVAVLQLTYSSSASGTYLIPSSSETGTFTSN